MIFLPCKSDIVRFAHSDILFAKSNLESRHGRVYHTQLVAVYHQHEVLYIIIAKEIQPVVDNMRLRR